MIPKGLGFRREMGGGTGTLTQEQREVGGGHCGSLFSISKSEA